MLAGLLVELVSYFFAVRVLFLFDLMNLLPFEIQKLAQNQKAYISISANVNALTNVNANIMHLQKILNS